MVSISVRELTAVSRRVLWRLGVPSALLSGGTRLVVSSEIEYGNGISVLLGKIASGKRERYRAPKSCVADGIALLDGRGQSLLALAATAVDLAHAVSVRGQGCVAITNARDLELAGAVRAYSSDHVIGLAALLAAGSLELPGRASGSDQIAGVILSVAIGPRRRSLPRYWAQARGYNWLELDETRTGRELTALESGLQVDEREWEILSAFALGSYVPPSERSRCDAGPGPGDLSED